MLEKGNVGLYERYTEDKDGFSLMQSNDAATRRNTKIGRFKQEKELQLKLEVRYEPSKSRQTLTSCSI